MLQTRAGNPKVPSYKIVADWVLQWTASKSRDQIAASFQLCGLVARSAFDEEKLHPPLRDLLSGTISTEERHQRYQHLLDENDDREELCIAAPEWYLPDDIRTSLFCCLRYSLGATIGNYVGVLTRYMESLQDLDGLFDDSYLEGLRGGDVSPGGLEHFAASKMHCCDIEVTTLDEDCDVIGSFAYTVDNAIQTIHIARLGPYFTLKVNGMHLQYSLMFVIALVFSLKELPCLQRLGAIQEYNA